MSPLFHVVLFQPEIPDNTGAIGRTCVGVDAKLWLVRPLGFQIDHRRIKRAGLDYWEYLDVEIVDCWLDLTQHLSGKRFWFMSKKAETIYTDVQFALNDVFVFGCETKGLPNQISQKNQDKLLKIPISQNARCLNLSVSVGVTLFEAKRQVVSLQK
ncbi:MAG: tRNA (cytidine(34)-2'-O)-methyltransferase [Planctomycetaceae bacterium]|jgi:tRNA (cytidine/uridine-2'-O-)-methyltransferase|nr:tRNA (cytidine(34)-2'-O)-methyltransferase [Planctomycetaceae bacterium]